MSAASSAGSAGSTTASTTPDTGTSSSASPTPTGERCSPPAGPESPSTTTCETWAENKGGDIFNTGPVVNAIRAGRASRQTTQLIFSAAGSPARTSASPDDAPGSTPANDPASSSSSPASQTLFDPDGFSSRTYPVSSLHRAVGTSEQCLERWPTSGTAWAGGFSTHVSSECRSDDDGCSSSEPSLTAILEPPQSVPGRYSLSGRAARGILRRAEKRGRTLPSHLSAALAAVARTTTTGKADG